MIIFLENFTSYKISKDFFDKISKAIKKEEKTKNSLSLEVVLLGEKGIRNINKRYAGKNKVTTVLSFPLSEIKKPSKKDLKEFIEPKEENNLLGEILLCPTRIKKVAKRYKKDFKGELAFNFIHGFLHLLGYNHKNTKDTREMRKKEREILNKIKIAI
jgi:probable rRNA maturation factor